MHLACPQCGGFKTTVVKYFPPKEVQCLTCRYRGLETEFMKDDGIASQDAPATVSTQELQVKNSDWMSSYLENHPIFGGVDPESKGSSSNLSVDVKATKTTAEPEKNPRELLTQSFSAGIDNSTISFDPNIGKPHLDTPRLPKTPLEVSDDFVDLEEADYLDIPEVPIHNPLQVFSDQQTGDFGACISLETTRKKSIIVDCPICGKNIFVPVPEDIVRDSSLPVVPVTYVHGDPAHGLTLHLDHDFQVRRRRTSAVVIEQK